jgi:hypothetical protein
MPRFASREEYEAWKSGAATAPPAPSASAAMPSPTSSPAPPPAKAKKAGLKETFSGLPGWAWPFVVACFAIPLISLGGALPTGIGFGAAAGCAQVAKKPDWETMPRVLACAGIAGVAWVLFLALIAAMAQVQK